MAKKILVVVTATFSSLIVALLVLRWFAPGLIGVPSDLQLVRVSKTVPPFFENVFRDGDVTSKAMILPDPLTIKRARPLMPEASVLGPHDILGFRNRSVPYSAEVVTIGDSQTYGNNAVLEANWPSQLASKLPEPSRVVYNMSCGGWDGAQYLYACEKALRLRPKVIVVAFYSGNDPIGAFSVVYGASHWRDLRPDPGLADSDAPAVNWPPQPDEMWSCTFGDGSKTTFTPELRLASNLPSHPAVEAGWEILSIVAQRMAAIVIEAGAVPLMTVIPTKELVYARRIQEENIQASAMFRKLVNSELENIDQFAMSLVQLEIGYVDLVRPLQEAARNEMLYPEDSDGHPHARGYQVIAEVLLPEVSRVLPAAPKGLVRVQTAREEFLTLVRNDGRWMFQSVDLVEANGWDLSKAPIVREVEIAGVPVLGAVKDIDPSRWGPP
jgi:lysophospholipase L1-like esterase